MRQSQVLGTTRKETPREAHTPGHQLLLRAGCLRPAAPGIYTILPYLQRVLRRLEGMCRTEWSAAAFEEYALPLLQPGQLSEVPPAADPITEPAEGRFRLEDRRGNWLHLASGNAAIAAAVAAKEIRSYKDLPKRLFQLQKQFVDHPRTRTALIDDREFLALEAMAFDPDDDGSVAAYRALQAAAEAVCRAAGLAGRWVEADLAIEGRCRRHEWIAPVVVGEESFVWCSACGYAARSATAGSRLEVFAQDTAMKPMAAVHGPGLIGVGPLAEFLGIPIWKTTKTLLFLADERAVAVMVRGDCDVDEEKVKRHLGCRHLSLAPPHVIGDLTGAAVGYAGGVGLPAGVMVLADHYTRERVNFECGANRTDYHLINVNWDRDLPLPTFGDFKSVRPGEGCPRCDSGQLVGERGIRVAGLSDLGSSLSVATGLSYQEKGGRPQPVFLATGEINLYRLAAAIVEQHHDEHGLRWPAGVAPFQVHLIGLNLEDASVRGEAEKIYQRLREEKIEVLFDDRDARAGEKFSDADLIGIPVRLTISRRTLKEGRVEFRQRGAPESEPMRLEDVIQAMSH